jgi:hypothetical protein
MTDMFIDCEDIDLKFYMPLLRGTELLNRTPKNPKAY